MAALWTSRPLNIRYLWQRYVPVAPLIFVTYSSVMDQSPALIFMTYGSPYRPVAPLNIRDL